MIARSPMPAHFPSSASWSGLGQGPLHLGGASHIERCHPAVVLGMGIGATLYEKLDDGELPAIDGAA